jgi:hypothetical protein
MKRTREHGTIEYTNPTPAERIDAVRQVVRDKTYARIDGCMADLFTCSAIINIYDALNDTNKAKLAALPFPRMGKVALSLLK